MTGTSSACVQALPLAGGRKDIVAHAAEAVMQAIHKSMTITASKVCMRCTCPHQLPTYIHTVENEQQNRIQNRTEGVRQYPSYVSTPRCGKRRTTNRSRQIAVRTSLLLKLWKIGVLISRSARKRVCLLCLHAHPRTPCMRAYGTSAPTYGTSHITIIDTFVHHRLHMIRFSDDPSARTSLSGACVF